MKKLVMVAAAASVLLMSGCASVFNEKTQPISVSSSNGKPFKGTVDGNPFNGPAVVPVYRQKNAKVFRVETEGCAPQTSVDSNVDPKFFGNIVIGGVLGSTTDYSTDKMWKYSDNVVITCDNATK